MTCCKKIKIDLAVIASLLFCQKAVEEITESPLECSAILTGSEKYSEKHSDMYIPFQEIDKASVKYKNLSEIFRHLKKTKKRLVGLWHSHRNHTSHHSQQDIYHLRNLEIKNTLYCQKTCKKAHGLISIINGCHSDVECKLFEDGVLKDIKLEVDYELLQKKSRVDLVKEVGKKIKYKGKPLRHFKRYKSILRKYQRKSLRREREIAKIIHKS